MADYESWKNATNGLLFIRKYNGRGELDHEAVQAKKTFHVTPQERRINQEMAAVPEQDFFSNGMLTPVRLIDTEEDAKEIASNPNLMSESDMKGLFKSQWKTFSTKVAGITNETTLKRMLEMARDDDSGASVKQADAIEARLRDVAPAQFVEVTSAPISNRPQFNPTSQR